MREPNFVHLHLHSEYSLSDGIIRIEELIERSKALNFPAIALTDLSNLFGLIKFYRLARNAGIKPIIGSEINLVKEKESSPSPLVLLIKNKKGYINLTKLVSKAFIEGQQKGEPLVHLSWLEDHAEGLIALSAGEKGHIGQALISDNIDLALKRIEYFKKIFEGDFFLEIQRLGKQNEEFLNNQIIKLSRDAQTPLVATCDVRFLNSTGIEEGPSDFEAHEARVCIQKGNILSDKRRVREYTESQYLQSAEEIEERFNDLPEALSNSVRIAKKCNLELDLDQFFLPDFIVPKNQSTEQYLKDISLLGLKNRFEQIKNSVNTYSIDEKVYLQRLNYELEMICKLGFAGYFLIVADFVNWAKKNEIAVGPGRGSGAGSITAYALGITSIDPLRYDLLFERFLNPERVSNPDFDVDFCMEGRDRVLEYVTQKYGKNAVAQISTRGTMAARAVLRDVVRVLGKPYGFGDRLAKSIPDVLGINLSDAYSDKEFKELIDSSTEATEVFQMALKLEGLSRSVGTHAAGVVIAPTSLTDFTPLIVDPEKGTVATQFDMGDVESVGLVKFDFLGLKTLTVIDQTIKRINTKISKRTELIDVDNISLNDKKTFELLQKGNTTGVFQLESRGMKDYLRQLIPNSFEDIVSMNALYRPGALGMNMVDSYIERKHGKKEFTYGHETVEKILGTTYGVIVYQEQVMQIAQELSGFSLGQADILRRAMGKKKKDEMEKMRHDFIQGAIKKQVSKRYAENLFNQIEQFAGYGFNKSHSVGYALIAYQTAWLKAHYLAEFMASILSCELDSTDRIQMFVEDCRSNGVEVKKPDINRSLYAFKDIDSSTILYGLGAIKGVGETLILKIIKAREEAKFRDLLDFCKRVGVNSLNKRILTALIGSGAMDSFGERSRVFSQIDSVLKMAEQKSEREKSKILDLFGDNEPLDVLDNEDRSSREAFDVISSEWSALGFYLDSHPLDQRKEEVRNMCGLFISELEIGNYPQRVAGALMNLNVRQGKKGRFAFATIDDSSGRLEVSIWAEVFEKYRNVLRKGQIVVVEGIIEKDEYSSDLDKVVFKMAADKILSFNEARNEFLKHIKIKLDSREVDVKNITAALKDLCSNEGNPVLISYLGDRANVDILLSEDYSLSLDDQSLIQLREICGKENVELVYHARPYLH